MPELGDVFSGASGGALGGFAIGGPVGAGVGALAGAGLSLFGESASEKREKNYQRVKDTIMRLRRENEAQRRKTLQEGIQRLGRYGGGLIAGTRGAAAQRMAARGRTSASDVESAILPAEQRATSVVGRTLEGYATDVNARFDAENAALSRAELTASMDFANAPIEPSVGEHVLAGGQAISGFLTSQKYINALKNAGGPLGMGGGYSPSKNVLGGSGVVKKPMGLRGSYLVQ